MLSRARLAAIASYGLSNATGVVSKAARPSVVILNNRWISQSSVRAKEDLPQTSRRVTLKELIQEKTGTTGPYVLGFGLLAYLLSKEILVIHDETLIAATVFGVSYFLIRRLGEPTAEYLDNEGDDILNTLNEGRKMQIAKLEEAIKAEEDIKRMFNLQNEVFDVMRQNNAMSLELEYRKRQQQVHNEVKKRLDYQLDVEQTKRRQEKDHLISWLEKQVTKSITAQQEKDILSQCLVDLKSIANSNKL